MDNSWALRVHSAKHFSAVQAAHLNNSEGDDDAGACFPCPFCYVDVEFPVLCSHLQEEHYFDFKNAVCPLCAANLGKDVIGHFTVQHANSVKRRKSPKSGFWTNGSVMLGKDLQEVSLFNGSNSMNVRGNVHESAPDPLLSPFIFNTPPSDPKDENQNDECCSCGTATAFDVKSAKPCISDDIQAEDNEERRQRAAFCQQLILSTIF
ncbi:protein DEHYDRATION-INDUCED 19 homolog 6-like [Cornus florida]|uniref:protein DEHYDRATION-INDUCED 19 homolog 6-like n=1 Tax=Cornus florida TaxID=4283 RepID=UPI00289B51E9|nr:protein DEHYDRATION-INDUCED 19 homolog 6-like [Cornus florida]